jgi:DNA-binding GntR family transcriptional regulator
MRQTRGAATPSGSSASPQSDERGQTRAEQAYQHIVNAIRIGSLTPGTRIREAELSERIGLSRTPVREALSRLLAEGLVANDPARGMVITELDHGMMSELYEMRSVLEGAAARMAARHASETEIAFLHTISERDAQLSEPAALARNNRLFHATLYRCAHNRYLVNTLNMLQAAMMLLGPTTRVIPGRPEAARHEHGLIVEALERRDGDAAETHAQAHIRQAYAARLEAMLTQESR